MTTTGPTPPAAPVTIQAFIGEAIPASLKAQKRWTPWHAVIDEKTGKIQKIPMRATIHAPHYGLSTAKPDAWSTYAQAEAALKANPDVFAGLGYLMTGVHGVVGVDLDKCVVDGEVAPWAQTVINDMASYAEISPSGRGVRIWSDGAFPYDWNNHKVGIEVYSGHEPRFLTVTGQHLPATPSAVTPASLEVLPALALQYAKEKTTATVPNINVPDVLDDLVLPDIAELDLHHLARSFLDDGEHSGDRSRTLHTTALALASAGLSAQEIFSTLMNNPRALEVALDKRHNDFERAALYLWSHHAQPAFAKVAAKSSFDDFDVIDNEYPTAPAAASAAVIDPNAEFSVDDFDDVSAPGTTSGTTVVATAKPAAPALRYKFLKADAFIANAKPVNWLIKKVLPHGELGVLYGESGAGKSFIALDMALAVAQGGTWRGKRVNSGAVAYVVAEGASGFAMRMKAWQEHHGVDIATLPFYALPAAPNFLESKDIKDLLESLKTIPDLKLIIVDTLAQVTPGANENTSEDMGKALKYSQILSQRSTGMVLLLAHSGKDSSKGIRGWSGIKGALDVEIKVERDKHKRSATVSKMKDGEGELDCYPFELDTVVLGQDADGDDITSCVLKAGEVGAQSAKATTQLKGGVQKAVMEQLETLCALVAPASVPVNTLLQSVVAILPHDDTKADRRREVAQRALKALEMAGHVVLAAGMVALP